MSAPRYAELRVTSQFSFLRGASSAEELFATAATMGIKALAVTDRNSLAGIVRAHEAAMATGVRLIVGCRLDLAFGRTVFVYPMDRAAYARLCRLLTLGETRAGKGKCHLDWSDLAAHAEGLIAMLVPDLADEICAFRLRPLREVFGDRANMALTLRRRPNDQLPLHELATLAARMKVTTVMTNDVLYHEPSRRILHDVVIAMGSTAFRRNWPAWASVENAFPCPPVVAKSSILARPDAVLAAASPPDHAPATCMSLTSISTRSG